MLRPAVAGASTLVVAALLTATGCSGSAPSDPPPATSPPSSAGLPSASAPSNAPTSNPPPTNAPPRNNLPAIGALFLPGHAQHYCTASVVDSDSGNVVLTAAHCLAGSGRGLRFVPGYGVGGSGPSGSWTVVATYAPPEWLHGQDAAHDYAFLTVQPAPRPAGSPQTVEGAEGSVGTPGPPHPGRPVTVVGYELGANDRQVTCASPIATTNGDPTVHCPGLGLGTSGAPWVTPPADQPNAGGVVGLVGGPHQGGCTSEVSYSPTFDSATTALMRRASAAGPGDALPVPDDDGC